MSAKIDSVDGKVLSGQGEYLVFRDSHEGDYKEVSRETFEKVYRIFNEYAPYAIMQKGSEKALDKCFHRYEIIKAKVKEIDPSLEVAFIPQTLYELFFIQECIEEDVRNHSVCPVLRGSCPERTLEDCEGDQKKYQAFLDSRAKMLERRRCWHRCNFYDFGNNNDPSLVDVAFRVNDVLIKALSPTKEGFSFQEILTFTEREISYLRAYYDRGNDAFQRQQRGEEITFIVNPSGAAPSTNFAYETRRGSIMPMGIRDEKDAQIIRNAVALECSKRALATLFIYRGSIFQFDTPYSRCNRDVAYSLSYGKSLFAGSLFDPEATAFYYMRDGKNAYAIGVPFDQLFSSPFFIPPSNELVQLFSEGEAFHVRTKAWKGSDLYAMQGVNIGKHLMWDRSDLQSKLSQEEFIAQFERYKVDAVQLKSS